MCGRPRISNLEGMTRTHVSLQQNFAGIVLTQGDPGYDDAREIFNAMIDRRPAVIAQCRTVEDVKAALAYGQREGLDIAVRSGGHSVAGASVIDGGLVVDLRLMNEVSVDADARTATVAGGATWADVDRACQPHGLATVGGRVSSTGVAGLTLGGGSGWFERKFGLASDALISVDLVTADGREVTASAEENPDLFWALHGGGGNFGVATRFVFALQPLPVTAFALLLWLPETARTLLRTYRDMVDRGLPLDLGGGMAYLTGPPLPFVPDELQGRRLIGMIATYAGSEAEMRSAIAPLLALNPVASMIAELPYTEIQSALDDPPGFRNYWSAQHLAALSDEAIDVFIAQGEAMLVPSPSQHLILPWGGAVADHAENWPQPHRSAAWVVHPFGLWEDPADDDYVISWARNAVAGLQPYSTGAVYLNFIGNEGEDRIVSGFGRDNYDRLTRVKAEYDPANVFRLNHNIKPWTP